MALKFSLDLIEGHIVVIFRPVAIRAVALLDALTAAPFQLSRCHVVILPHPALSRHIPLTRRRFKLHHYPELKPLHSPQATGIYWRAPLSGFSAARGHARLKWLNAKTNRAPKILLATKTA